MEVLSMIKNVRVGKEFPSMVQSGTQWSLWHTCLMALCVILIVLRFSFWFAYALLLLLLCFCCCFIFALPMLCYCFAPALLLHFVEHLAKCYSERSFVFFFSKKRGYGQFAFWWCMRDGYGGFSSSLTPVWYSLVPCGIDWSHSSWYWPRAEVSCSTKTSGPIKVSHRTPTCVGPVWVGIGADGPIKIRHRRTAWIDRVRIDIATVLLWNCLKAGKLSEHAGES